MNKDGKTKSNTVDDKTEEEEKDKRQNKTDSGKNQPFDISDYFIVNKSDINTINETGKDLSIPSNLPKKSKNFPNPENLNEKLNPPKSSNRGPSVPENLNQLSDAVKLPKSCPNFLASSNQLSIPFENLNSCVNVAKNSKTNHPLITYADDNLKSQPNRKSNSIKNNEGPLSNSQKKMDSNAIQTPASLQSGIQPKNESFETPPEIASTPTENAGTNCFNEDQVDWATLNNNTKIEKLPYNGKSKYLISKIFLIGYERSYIFKIIKAMSKAIKKAHSSHIEKIQKQKFYKFKKLFLKAEEVARLDEIFIPENPVVLSCFSRDNNPSIENDQVINNIFPQSQKLFKYNQNEFESRNIVFSYNIPLSDGTKSSQNYYAYIYYEQLSCLKEIYYCPKAICFESNYPFFSHFQTLSMYYELQNGNSQRPCFDLWLYHLLYLPSPISLPYQLYYYPVKPPSLTPITFDQLSGYPLFHFDLEMLFRLYKPGFITEIFLHTFLEQDIIFFSENLEVLNIIMYIFSNLNYPLNDSSYFFHVVSVSLDAFLGGTDVYVNKTFSSMLGVNASYDPSYDAFAKATHFYIVDLENKKIHYRYKQNCCKEFDVITNLKINSCLSKLLIETRKKHSQNLFEKAIFDLFLDLSNASNSITHINIKPQNQFPTLFFEYSKLICLKTKTLQVKFYYFIIKLLSFFNDKFELKGPNKSTKAFKINYATASSDSNLSGYFTQKFQECSKYNTYIANFIQNNDSIDVHKIPLLFLEEFVHQFSCNKSQNINSSNLFETIDKYYAIIRKAGIKYTLETYYNNLNANLPSSYEKLHFELDFRFIKKISNNAKKPPEQNKKSDLIRYFHFMKANATPYLSFLNDNDKCIYFKENKSLLSLEPKANRYHKFFQAEKIQIRKELSKTIAAINEKMPIEVNQIPEDHPSFIQGKIEKNIIEGNDLGRNEICICCFIMFFIVSRTFCTNDNLLGILPGITQFFSLTKGIYSARKYLTMLIIQFTNIIKKKREEKQQFSKEKEFLIELTFLLVKLNVIPNEELMQYLNGITERINYQAHKAQQLIASPQDEIIIQSDYYTSQMNYNISQNGILNEADIIRLSNTLFVGNICTEAQDNPENSPSNDDNKKDNKQDNKKDNNKVLSQPNLTTSDQGEKTKKSMKGKIMTWTIKYNNESFRTHFFSPYKIYCYLAKKCEETITNVVLLNFPFYRKIVLNLIFYIHNIHFFTENTTGEEEEEEEEGKTKTLTTKKKTKTKPAKIKYDNKKIDTLLLRILFHWLEIINDKIYADTKPLFV